MKKSPRKCKKSGCSLCKSENPLYKNIPSEKNLLLTNKFSCWIFAKTSQFKSLSFENKYLVTYYLFLKIIIGYEHMQHLLVSKMGSGEKIVRSDDDIG